MDRGLPLLVASAFPDEVKALGADGVALDGVCAYCHQKRAVVPYRQIVKPTFKEQHWFAGVGFCSACAFAISHTPLRWYNWLFQDGKATSFKHQAAWSYFCQPISPPFALTFTTSHKKHQIVYGERNFASVGIRFVVFDQRLVVYDTEHDAGLFAAVYEMYNALAQPKATLLSGEYRVAYMDSEQYARLCVLDRVVSSYRSTPLLEMAVAYVQRGGNHERS